MKEIIGYLKEIGLKTNPITDDRTGRLQGIFAIGEVPRAAIEKALRSCYEGLDGKLLSSNESSADLAFQEKSGRTTYVSIDQHPGISIITLTENAALHR